MGVFSLKLMYLHEINLISTVQIYIKDITEEVNQIIKKTKPSKVLLL